MKKQKKEKYIFALMAKCIADIAKQNYMADEEHPKKKSKSMKKPEIANRV